MEKKAIGVIGIPSVILKDSAGRAVAESILKTLGQQKRLDVAVICGTGNNGGDGFVAARYLWAQGVNVTVFLIGSTRELKPDAKVFYSILKALKIPVVLINKISQSTADFITGHEIIIDALFGIGLNRPLTGICQEMVELINASRLKVWSVDIPSGLDGTTGKVLGVCVRALTTVSFTVFKKGFYINDGPAFTGTIEKVDIGIPDVLLGKMV